MSQGISSLDIGRSALLSYQGAMQVVGNNVSNAGNADYTRQTPNLVAMPGSFNSGLNPGAGVALSAIQRHLDETLENRLRLAIASAQSSHSDQELFASIESLFDDTNGTGLSAPTQEFFSNLSSVQNDASDLGVREVTVSSGAALADSIRTLRSDLLNQVNSQMDQTTALIQQADDLVQRIADLNGKISAASAGGSGMGGPLRDQRDAALRQLSELMDIQARVQPDGSAYVYVGSEALVQNGIARSLVAEETLDGELRTITLRFADTDSEIRPQGGRLGALISSGGKSAVEWMNQLDQFAASLIAEFNRIHADGQGLKGFTSVTGTAVVQDPASVLSNADLGLVPAPTHGSFFLTVSDDATQTPHSFQVDVDLDGIGQDDSLQSLVDKINSQVTGVTAAVSIDNRLTLTADAGSTFYLGLEGDSQRKDTSGILAALGVNTFFTGSSAADIGVNPLMLADSSYLAASQSGLSGDGNNAGQLALVAETESSALGGTAPLTYYGAIANEIAVSSASARNAGESADTVLGALQAQKESISGVNLDEEAIQLVKFEQAYQGAARFVAVVQRTLQELMSIVQ